jgi:signal transduction histidine kinase
MVVSEGSVGKPAASHAEQDRRASTVIAVARPVAVLAFAVALLCLVPGVTAKPVGGLVVNLVAAGASYLSVVLARRGRPTVAGVSFLTLMTLLFGASFFMFGGLLGQYVVFFPVLVCLAGLSLSNRWALGMCGLVCSMVVVALVLERLGRPIPQLDPGNTLNRAVVICSAVATTALLVGVALKRLERYHWELVSLEREREQTQRLESLGTLAGSVAHDVNNLLGAVMGHSELIQLEPALSDQVRESSEQIAEATKRAGSLVRQLLTFAQRQTEGPSDVDLDTVVREFEPLLARLLPPGITLRLQLAAGDRVRGHRIQLEQVILNLVVNARDALPEGGTICIETASIVPDAAYCSRHALRPGRYVRLAVRDDGVGIVPEVIARLFEPFFTTKPPGKGTGLGLATVHGIVKRAAGHLDVQSTPGEGSTFEVLLPCVDASAGAAEKPAAAVATRAQPSPGCDAANRGHGRAGAPRTRRTT